MVNSVNLNLHKGPSFITSVTIILLINKIILFSEISGSLSYLLGTGIPLQSDRGKNLTIYLHLVKKIRMRGAIIVLPHTPSRRSCSIKHKAPLKFKRILDSFTYKWKRAESNTVNH